jgi:hypothetical protein
LYPGENVNGSRFEEPFQRLCEKGYLIATDVTGRKQGFKVNSRVYAGKKKAAKVVPEEYHYISGDYDAPWLS